MKTVRWGIIGCGDVTEVKSGPGFQKARGSALVAVMRRDSAKAADYARRHNVPRWYDNADKLIADPEVDAVYVATPPDTHEFYALKVAAAGKPCYVEKPMTRNTAEAERIVAAFEARKLPLYVAFYRRGLSRFRKVEEILDSRKLGQLQSVTYRLLTSQMKHHEPSLPWRLDPAIAGAGLFLDLGSHALDLLDLFLGPLKDVKGAATNHDNRFAVEDTVDMTFSAASGATGEAHWSFISDERVDEYCFKGDKGELRISCFGQEPFSIKYLNGTEEKFDLPHPPHVQQQLIQLMVDEMNGIPGADPMPSTGASGLRTQRVMDQVLASYYSGRGDGCWDRLTAKHAGLAKA